MLRHRVIPVLLLHNGGLVKTKQFSKPIYLGDPLNAINIFNDKEVDELIFLDIDATKKSQKIDFELISDIASECFMPFAYGGGISTIEEIEKLFYIGVEKVIINSALSDTSLINEAIRRFGSQSIVASIDIKDKKIYSHVNKKTLDIEIETYIKNIESLQVGEIFVNSVDRDGMMEGYDIDLIQQISRLTNIPIIACGGAGKIEDLKEIIDKTDVSAVGAGSFFVFVGVHNAVLITYPKYKDLEEILESSSE
jgi:cyclase